MLMQLAIWHWLGKLRGDPMTAMEEANQLIELLENIPESLKKYEKMYIEAYNSVGVEDRRSQDLLHAIEFEPSGKARNKLATKLKECRVTRRHNKDLVEILEPVYQYMQRDQNRKAINLLEQTLGSVRKIVKKHQNRVYIPRVEETGNDMDHVIN